MKKMLYVNVKITEKTVHDVNDFCFIRPGFGADGNHHDFIEAEDYGRSYGNCWSAFPDCPMSMREMLHEFFLNNADIPTKK